MSFIAHLSSIISISKDLEQEITAISKTIRFSKGDQLIGIGERCNHLYFIHQGLVRGYYFLDGKEITNWFAQEEEFATCFYAFIAERSSFEHVQALETPSLQPSTIKPCRPCILLSPKPSASAGSSPKIITSGSKSAF